MGRMKLMVLLVAMLLVGVSLGIVVNGLIIQSRIRHFSQVPANIPEHITEKLTERLALDGAQQKAIRAALDAHDVRMKAAREEGRAIFDRLVGQMHEEVSELLTEEQRPVYEKMIQERKERREKERRIIETLKPKKAPPAP